MPGALMVAGGTALCITGVGVTVGAGLIAGGVSSLASSTFGAMGVDSKYATMATAGLDVVGGATLLLTPFAAVGAGMIGAGAGSLVGGEISEELGGSYELGAFVGNLVGGVAGSMLYKYADKIPRTVKGCVDLDATIGRGGSSNCSTLNRGQGYDSFEQAKNALGSAGEGKAWHHIVEQSQIQKSGFSATDIHNTKNLVAIDSGYSGSIHSQISGYYNSKQPFTNGLSVRNWLANQDFNNQFEFGLKELSKRGTMTPTATGWTFTPF